MTRKSNLLSRCVAAAVLYAANGTASAEVVAVVSPKNSVTSLTANQLADIYLGRSGRFPGGSIAIPCDLAEDSPLREEFYSKFLGKSTAQIKSHWAKLIFTGRGQPPREVASGEAAKRFVNDNPGAVCYIDKRLADRTVTVLIVN